MSRCHVQLSYSILTSCSYPTWQTATFPGFRDIHFSSNFSRKSYRWLSNHLNFFKGLNLKCMSVVDVGVSCKCRLTHDAYWRLPRVDVDVTPTCRCARVTSFSRLPIFEARPWLHSLFPETFPPGLTHCRHALFWDNRCHRYNPKRKRFG